MVITGSDCICTELHFEDGDDVTGKATVDLKSNSRLEHQGIKVELIGQVGIPI